MYVALAVDHEISAEPEHDDYGYAQHEFEGGPEHSHQADETQAAADVFLVGGFEGGDLGLFLHIGADDSGAGEIFLGAGRDVGEHGFDGVETPREAAAAIIEEHGLDAFEALVNAASEILDDDAGDGQREKGE